MIECYFRWCKFHDKEEPFCTIDECVATEEQIKEFDSELYSAVLNPKVPVNIQLEVPDSKLSLNSGTCALIWIPKRIK